VAGEVEQGAAYFVVAIGPLLFIEKPTVQVKDRLSHVALFISPHFFLVSLQDNII
jgi:hypothetical protein